MAQGPHIDEPLRLSPETQEYRSLIEESVTGRPVTYDEISATVGPGSAASETLGRAIYELERAGHIEALGDPFSGDVFYTTPADTAGDYRL